MYRDVPPEIADPEDYEIEYENSEDFPDYSEAGFFWTYTSNDSQSIQNIKVKVWDKQSVWDDQSIEDEVEWYARYEVIKTSEDYVVIADRDYWKEEAQPNNQIVGSQGLTVIVKDTPYYYEIYMNVEKDPECPVAGFEEHYEDFINTIKCIID